MHQLMFNFKVPSTFSTLILIRLTQHTPVIYCLFLDVTELPPQMGLLSRLWNLNTRGCSLQDPLKSMIDSKKYKTMDIVGYLKSVLEDARPYARMKLMIVGVQGIGKTSLLEQLRQEGITRRKSEVGFLFLRCFVGGNSAF